MERDIYRERDREKERKIERDGGRYIKRKK